MSHSVSNGSRSHSVAPKKGHKATTSNSNPMTVIVISFALFLVLISLPWMIDNIQESIAQRKQEPTPSQAASGYAQFGTPRIGELKELSTGAIRSGQLHPASHAELSYSRSSQISAGSNDYTRQQPAVSYGLPAELSQQQAGQMTYPGAVRAAQQAEPATATQRQLDPALQAPAEAMAQLLAGKNVSLDSYYGSLSGGAPLPGADSSSAGGHMDRTTPTHSGRHHKGVYERHQMFVMR